MVRARNDGEQGKRCGLAGQSGPKSFAAAFLNILSEKILLFSILAVVWRRCWYTEAGNVLHVSRPSQGGTFEKNFARCLAFTVRTFVAKRRRAVKSLVCSRRGTKYDRGDFCGRSRRGALSPR